MEKKQYQPPRVEIILVENEGVMAASGNIGDFTNPTPLSTGTSYSSKSKSVQSAGPLQELEDIINDILTVKR